MSAALRSRIGAPEGYLEAETGKYAAMVFSLGPVQEFISSARKGQDFWFGSWLLSELSRTAARVANEAPGVEMVLPAKEALGGSDAVANKILTRVPTSDAASLAEAMRQAVQERIRSLGKTVFDRIEDEAGGKATWLQRSVAEAQLADLVEVYWVAVDEVDGNWGPARALAEAGLAARKSLRDFAPVRWGSANPKSALDGQRESVVHRDAYLQSDDRLRRIFGVSKGEPLCGVGLLKRNGRYAIPNEEARGARVVSTAHIASWSLRRAWSTDGLKKSKVEAEPARQLQNDLKRMFADYRAALVDLGGQLTDVPPGHEDPVLGRTDGQVLFSGRLRDLEFGDEENAARSALERFLTEVSTKLRSAGVTGPRRPSPYYAVVRADGDKMGAWLDSLKTPKAQAMVSACLLAFTKAAETEVAEHHGHCLFAGGDDVLALVPVSAALDCAAALQKCFTDAIAKAPTADVEPSLSVGIQIAHATDPFRDALEGALAAETFAKRDRGRNAWAVRLDKRSGAPLMVGGKWNTLVAFRELQNLQDSGPGGLPRGLAYDLRGIVSRMPTVELPCEAKLAVIRALELHRILEQKDVKRTQAAPLWSRVQHEPPADDHLPAVGAPALEQLCDELVVTRALAGLDGGDE